MRKFFLFVGIFGLGIASHVFVFARSINWKPDPDNNDEPYVLVCDYTTEKAKKNGKNCTSNDFNSQDIYIYPYNYVVNFETYTPERDKGHQGQGKHKGEAVLYFAEKFIFPKEDAGKIFQQEFGFYAVPNHLKNGDPCVTDVPLSSIEDTFFPLDQPDKSIKRCLYSGYLDFMDHRLTPTEAADDKYPDSITAFDSHGNELELPEYAPGSIRYFTQPYAATMFYEQDFDKFQFIVPEDGIIYLVNTFPLKSGWNDKWWFNYWLTFCHTSASNSAKTYKGRALTTFNQKKLSDKHNHK